MKPRFYRKVLKNGLTLLFEKRDLPIVSVSLAVRNGGINEDLTEKGISHYIEHMLYKGTETRTAKQIAEGIEKKGGELNGFTDEIITAYWCRIPSKHLFSSLEILTDMVKNSVFDENELDKERKVIFEEIKMRKDRPDIYVLDTIQSFLYSGSLAKPLIGSYETMNAIDRKKIMKKYKDIYRPNNMILCVVGDANLEEIIKFAEENFGNERGVVPVQKIKPKNALKIEKRKGIDQANVIFAYHVPIFTKKNSYAARLLNTIMADGLSSRLFTEIREKRNLAYAVKGATNINKQYAYNLIYIGTTKENVKKVKELILAEFRKVSKELSGSELNSAKEQLIGNYMVSSEDSREHMNALLYAEINGDVGQIYNFPKNVSSVKLRDVKKLASLKKYSFFALIPEEQ